MTFLITKCDVTSMIFAGKVTILKNYLDSKFLIYYPIVLLIPSPNVEIIQYTLLSSGANFPSFCKYMLLQVWMAYLQGASSRNSRVNSVSSPHGTFSSTWISSWDSERWAYRLRPMDFKLICGLAAKCTYHNSASPGVFAVHWRPSLLAPKKYPLARLLKAHRPEKSSQTDISNFDVSSLSSCKTKYV